MKHSEVLQYSNHVRIKHVHYSGATVIVQWFIKNNVFTCKICEDAVSLTQLCSVHLGLGLNTFFI